jgi:thioredoxin-related protein
VAIIAIGAKVKTNKSLLLFDEIKKIITPIKKEAIIFLNEVCNNCGRFERVKNMETTKNKATDT